VVSLAPPTDIAFLTPLQIALAGFAVFVSIGLIAKIAIGRWMIKSGPSPPRDSENNSP